MKDPKTAVERLEEKLNKWSDGRFYFPAHLFEEAKQIEKEQITTAYQADRLPCSDEDAEQYYNETFSK